MDNALVSVIVPVYNTPEDKLCACVSSLLAQTYTDMEILIIDDGSRAQTAQVLDQLAAGDARIRVVHQENGGVSAARNRGIELAAGEYLTFVDADDCVSEDFLAYAVELAQRYRADIVYGRILMCRQRPEKPAEPEPAAHAVIEEIWRVQEALLRRDVTLVEGLPYLDMGPCAKLYRRSCIADVRFPLGVRISEDQVFNHALLSHCRTCVVTNKEAYYYIENLQSVSHAHHPDAVEMIMQAMEMIRPHLMDHERMEQAFYFRVLADLFNAIQFAYLYAGENRLSFFEKAAGVRKARKHPLAAQALERLDIGGVASRAWRMKFALLKYSPELFAAFKMGYGWFKRIRG